ncbi:MAG: DNA polymerase III subunit delta [Lachnospiraceae bacterium]|nr:DNA polymerase III subunit delta [Lachnospiraceae bacterium]
MKTILNDIREGKLKKAYLLYGDEVYLKHQYRDNLLKAMDATGDSMNFSKFEGKDIEIREVIEVAETMPFFADYRTVLIVDSGWFEKATDEMCEYLKHPAETTRFIFVESKVDKRGRMFKTVKDLGNAVEFVEQDEAVLRKWITGLLQKEGKQITSPTLQFFLQRTGTDMNNIRTEIEKLVCYLGERTMVEQQDVEDIVTTRVQNHIFDMISAIAMKKQQRALQLYYDLLMLRESPMGILTLITRQFNLLMQTKELRNKGYDKNGIAKKLKLQPFVAEKYIQQAAGFKYATLREVFEECVNADEAIKTGRMQDMLCVELLIVKFSR